MLQPSDHHYIGDRDPGLLFHVRMVHYQSQRTGIEDVIFPFCIFYGGSVSDGHVHPVTDSGQSETQHSVEYLDHLSGIWSRKTIPMLIQYFRGSYGKVEMGPMMASIMLTVIPIVIVYLLGQKHIIKGVAAGAVKG